MSALLLVVAVLAYAALMADLPALAVLVGWCGLSAAVALVFGAASMIGRRPGEEDSRAP